MPWQEAVPDFLHKNVYNCYMSLLPLCPFTYILKNVLLFFSAHQHARQNGMLESISSSPFLVLNQLGDIAVGFIISIATKENLSHYSWSSPQLRIQSVLKRSSHYETYIRWFLPVWRSPAWIAVFHKNPSCPGLTSVPHSFPELELFKRAIEQ